MKIYSRFMLFFLFISPALAFSQNDYQSYAPQVASTPKGKVVFNIQNNNFVKNNEYFGEYMAGMTYIGSVLQPALRWEVDEKLALSTGWYFRYFYGRKEFDKSLPFIRVDYQPSALIKLTIGQLHARTSHNFAEPLYDTDRYFNQSPEYGVQLRLQNAKLFSEIFLDWENFILHGDKNQEIINAGIVSSYVLTPVYQTYHTLSVELQGAIRHKGGQINISDENLQTRSNIGTGLKYAYKLKNNIVKQFFIEAHYIQAFEMSPHNVLAAQKGFAVYPKISLENDYFKVSMAYLHGNNYFSPLGNHLFQSFAEQPTDSLICTNRDLLTHKLLFDYPIAESVLFGFKAETYYDIKTNSLEYSYGLNISLNLDIFERNFKNRSKQ